MSTNLKYPYKWSQIRVQEFTEKYGRGTENLSKILGLSKYDLLYYLTLGLARGNSFKWECLKRVVIYMHGYERDEIARFSPEVCEQLYKYILVLATDDALDEKNGHECLDTLRQRILF